MALITSYCGLEYRSAGGVMRRRPGRADSGPQDLEEPVQLVLPYGDRGVICMAFDQDQGRLLTTVSTDNNHSVRVWDWRENKELATASGQQPKSWPKSSRIVFNVDDESENGPNHLVLWVGTQVSRAPRRRFSAASGTRSKLARSSSQTRTSRTL